MYLLSCGNCMLLDNVEVCGIGRWKQEIMNCLLFMILYCTNVIRKKIKMKFGSVLLKLIVMLKMSSDSFLYCMTIKYKLRCLVDKQKLQWCFLTRKVCQIRLSFWPCFAAKQIFGNKKVLQPFLANYFNL